MLKNLQNVFFILLLPAFHCCFLQFLSSFNDRFVIHFFIAAVLFQLLSKLRPETKQKKKERLRARAQARVEGKQEEITKKAPVVRSGVNLVTKLVEQKKAQLVVIAHDVDPIEIIIHLPALCRRFKVWFQNFNKGFVGEGKSYFYLVIVRTLVKFSLYSAFCSFKCI